MLLFLNKLVSKHFMYSHNLLIIVDINSIFSLNLVVDSFRIMIQCMNTSVDRNQCDSVKFDLAEVWARVQSVMQMMLTDYLDFKAKNSLGLNPSNPEPSSTQTTADINSFFVRRKTQRPKREPVFRFDYSSTALNMKDYLKEQNSEENARSKRPLICPPNPHNITPIYASLMEFIGVIESALKVSLISNSE